MKRIILAGGSGFVGQALAPVLAGQGYNVVVLGRGAAHRKDGVHYLQWDGKTLADWARSIDGAEAIVNLTGKNINCRHTPENRREIIRSRVDSVRVLGEAIANCSVPPRVFVQTSGVGYYGDTGDRVADESAPLGNDFPAEVCRQWEGAFDALDLPSWFLGGAVANGRQFISWIHVADVVRAFVSAIEDHELTGVFNATAPAAATNREFMRELRRALHRPWSPPVPAPFARAGAWLMGSDGGLALLSSRCVPGRFLEHGFQFQFPTLRDALANLYQK